MKRIINHLLTLATVLLAGSCQQERFETAKDLSTVSFTVEVPGNAATKASGDDVVSNINNIVYAVYKTDAESLEDARISLAGKTPINCVNPLAKDPSNTTAFVNNNANISIELFNDQKYIILFWAQVNETWVEGEEFDLTNITYPEELVANSEDYAAFCGAAYVEKVKGSRSASVELTRPFAQINIASADPDFPVEITSSRVKVTGAGQYFNVATGEISGNTDVTFGTASIPTEEFSEAYPHYIASNYIFANGTVSVEYEINANLGQISTFESPISNVPVARNYKTNIVGNLLSSEIDYSVSLTEGWGTPDKEILIASNEEELLAAFEVGGYVQLTEDIELGETIYCQAGTDVHLDLNGKTISIDASEFPYNSNGYQYVFITREGSNLLIDGNGTIEVSTPAPIFFYPAGNLVIESGTFIRHIPERYNGNVGSMFVGTKPEGGWHSTGVTIKGGYFDSGYYKDVVETVEAILSGDAELEETETDKSKRGQSGDTNVTRKAIKEVVSVALNLSNNYIKIYGGTFVGVNPAWGDEGCMLPTTPYYLRPWSYYQGGFIEGQEFNENGIVLPEGYTITKGELEDGRPIYTVEYTQPEHTNENQQNNN